MMNKTICLSRGCYIEGNESNSTCCESKSSCNKLDVINWLENVPSSAIVPDVAEVRFKNNRKLFFRNVNNLLLRKGDIIAVEASPGHDIGVVSLVGDLIYDQMKKYNVSPDSTEIKKIYRKAKPTDLEKWREAISLENNTMIRARQIASSLNLNMKIGDVEYQGDRTKAIFYYIADERVDFRELIKILADEFRVRIEMKQIGARQEAGRIGGIGACGRELCCATWMSNFNSVTTNAARVQEISLNPQKLAGQCSKLKCCLNYELDVYLDARKGFPKHYNELQTVEGPLFVQKTDIFRRILWYSRAKDSLIDMIPLSVETVFEIIDLNKQGTNAEFPSETFIQEKKEEKLDFTNNVGQDSITRFDTKKNNNNKNKNRRRDNRNKRINKPGDANKRN